MKNVNDLSKPSPNSKYVVLDVGITSVEVDIVALATQIIAEVKIDGLAWKSDYKLVDIAYGLKKLQIGLVIDEDKVNINEVVGRLQAYVDQVYSVDIVLYNNI